MKLRALLLLVLFACGDIRDGADTVHDWFTLDDKCCVCLARHDGCINRPESACDEGGQFRSNWKCVCETCADECKPTSGSCE